MSAEHTNHRPEICTNCHTAIAAGEGIIGRWYSDEDDEDHYDVTHRDVQLCSLRRLQRRVVRLQEADFDGHPIAPPMPRPYDPGWWHADAEPEQRAKKMREIAHGLSAFIPLAPEGAEGYTHFAISGVPEEPHWWLVTVMPETEPEPEGDRHTIILHEPHT